MARAAVRRRISSRSTCAWRARRIDRVDDWSFAVDDAALEVVDRCFGAGVGSMAEVFTALEGEGGEFAAKTLKIIQNSPVVERRDDSVIPTAGETFSAGAVFLGRR